MFDEATSRTTFVIAHRLSTVRHADCTIVISEKGIAQTGTHESLMQADGVYCDLYALQMEESCASQAQNPLFFMF